MFEIRLIRWGLLQFLSRDAIGEIEVQSSSWPRAETSATIEPANVSCSPDTIGADVSNNIARGWQIIAKEEADNIWRDR